MSQSIRVRRERGKNKNNQSYDLSSLFDSIFVKFLLLGMSIFILISVYNSVNITIKKLDILKRAEKEVEDLRIQNLYLSISMKEMSTYRYLEKEARNRLNFGDTEEIVFVIPDTVMDQAEIDVNKVLESDKGEIVRYGSTFSSWVEFLMKGI
jgi:cell division protein FtsB